MNAADLQENEWTERLLAHVSRIHRQTIEHGLPSKPFNAVLTALLELTGSEYGFVGEVLRDELSNPYLKTFAATNIGWDDASRAYYAERFETGLEFRNLNTLFGHALLTGELFIANDPASHRARGGTPAGHPPLKAFAAIPIKAGDELIGMCGLANRPGGFPAEFALRLKPLLDATALMVGSARIERDLKKSRSEVDQQSLLRKMLIASASEGVIAVDDSGLIVDFNPAATRLFGWPRESAIGSRAIDLLSRPESKAVYASIFSGAEPWDAPVEMPSQRLNGTRCDIEISVMRCPPQECIAHILFINDLSERREARKALEQARALIEASHRTKMSFLAVASHEIRTPLSTILSALELINSSQLSESNREYLSAALTASDSLLNLVNNVLDVARFETGDLGLTNADFQPRALLQEIEWQFRVDAARANLTLKMEIDSALPAAIHGDRDRLRRILVNLVGNAIKFTECGGIRIDCRSHPADAGCVRLDFEVHDTGMGIPAVFRERIFDSFEQAGAALTTTFGGTGLGLSICRQLVNSLGGEIELKASSREGSVFAFHVVMNRALPAATATDSPRSIATTGASRTLPQRSKVVLVAEDNYLNQKLLCRQLEHGGYETLTAANGKMALTLLLAGGIDAAVMDLQMPQLSGNEVVRLWREHESRLRLARIPIVMLTGHAPEEFRMLALASGADAFLTKPYRAADLLRTLDSTLSAP
jgi:PAS domain S-box-containing protein